MNDTKEKCTSPTTHDWQPEGETRYHYEIAHASLPMVCTLCGERGTATWPLVPETLL